MILIRSLAVLAGLVGLAIHLTQGIDSLGSSASPSSWADAYYEMIQILRVRAGPSALLCLVLAVGVFAQCFHRPLVLNRPMVGSRLFAAVTFLAALGGVAANAMVVMWTHIGGMPPPDFQTAFEAFRVFVGAMSFMNALLVLFVVTALLRLRIEFGDSNIRHRV